MTAWENYREMKTNHASAWFNIVIIIVSCRQNYNSKYHAYHTQALVSKNGNKYHSHRQKLKLLWFMGQHYAPILSNQTWKVSLQLQWQFSDSFPVSKSKQCSIYSPYDDAWQTFIIIKTFLYYNIGPVLWKRCYLQWRWRIGVCNTVLYLEMTLKSWSLTCCVHTESCDCVLL